MLTHYLINCTNLCSLLLLLRRLLQLLVVLLLGNDLRGLGLAGVRLAVQLPIHGEVP